MLLEQPGSWGRDALMESRLPREFAIALRKKARAAGVRVVLIRRGVRLASEQRQCYFAQTTETMSRLSHRTIENLDDLLELDLAALKRGELVDGATERADKLFLVCTHGRHDACCSIRGNQVSRVACALPGIDAWECSHIGGDRFAANMVCFPDGVYFGRVTPEEVEALAHTYLDGRVSLMHYRGRSCYPFALQAAECFVRRESGLLGLADLTLLDTESFPGRMTATFALIDGRTADVEVAVTDSPSGYQLTCSVADVRTVPQYELAACRFSSAP